MVHRRLPVRPLLFDVSGPLWHDGPPIPEALFALCQGRQRVEPCSRMRFLSSMLSLDGDTMAELWHKVKHEFLEVLPPTIFFLITFHIVLLNRALMLREYGLHLSSMAAAAIMALLVAKVVLLADMLPLAGEAAHLQRGVEDGHLRGRLPLRALPGALHPPLVAHGKLHRRQFAISGA